MICRVHCSPRIMKYETMQNLHLGVLMKDGGTKRGNEGAVFLLG